MATKTHQSIREYVEAIRPIVDRGDAFGAYIMRMMPRESRISANGLFQCVREVREAIIALNGTAAEAREWTLQAYLWWSVGKAVEQKFAKYELDPRAAQAMDQLIKLLQAMPEELLKVTPPALPSPFRTNTNPFGSTPNPFGSKPTPPATPPATSPFGSRPAPSAPPPRPPFGQAQKPSTPFGQPAPTPPKPSPFPSRPNSPTPSPALPYHLAICFDALDVAPTVAPTGHPFPFGRPVEKVEEPLPTDLRGLLDRWLAVASEVDEAVPILHKIGELEDLQTLDIVHNLTSDGSTEINLIDTYKHIGGNVGIAGLLSLLPLTTENRIVWLDALCDVTQRAENSLNEMTLDTVWKIAVAESAPNVTFCPAALYLLAATRRSESLHILWTHARSEEADRRRIALYAIAQLDPGDTLGELLTAINDLPPILPPAQRNPFQTATPIEMSITSVGIPFERLESMVRHSKLKQALVALRFLSYHEDERVIPFLITQLTRRLLPLRSAALTHLRRLQATSAADAVVRAMHKESDLCIQAAEALCEWGDLRCVPVLLPHMISGDTAAQPPIVIRKLDALKHPDYVDWLLKTVETLKKYETEEADTLLTQIVNLLVELKSTYLEDVLKLLISSPSQRVRYAVVTALPKLTSDWTTEATRKLVLDSSPVVSYRAILLCHDPEVRSQLTASRSELQRLLAIRMLWLDKDIEPLRLLLADESAAVHDVATWALANLGVEDVADDLRRLVEKEDRIDMWHQNPAIIAWTGLARMGAVQAS